MKLLIALLFVLPLSVQAGHYKGKKKNHRYRSKSHKKSWHHRFHHNNQHYLTVGTALNFSKKEVGTEKTTSYQIKLGKGVIFKKKYDVSFLLNYNKDGEDKSYGLEVGTKYLFNISTMRIFKGKLSKYKNTYNNFYVGLGFGIDKSEQDTKTLKYAVGKRFSISKNMMMGLEYTNYVRKFTKADVENKTKGSRVTMDWNYFY
ncbi:MAG: hypothetical protein HAW60_03200 [Bdellovibrionales bacterium]|nr:hypothetical protein [Bdellovibrionales bacterium]